MRAPRCLAAIAGFAAAAAFGGVASAHPHVWIAVKCDFVFDGGGRPIGLRETWVFDEMYSALAVVGVRHGRASSEALTPLSRTIVSASKDQGHFTTVTLGGRALSLSEPSEIGAEWTSDQRLSVRFRVDFSDPAPLDAQVMRVEVHDPDLYADFQFDKQLSRDGLPAGCRTRIDTGDSTLPADPEERSNALINGPLLMLSSGLELTCASAGPSGR